MGDRWRLSLKSCPWLATVPFVIAVTREKTVEPYHVYRAICPAIRAGFWVMVRV